MLTRTMLLSSIALAVALAQGPGGPPPPGRGPRFLGAEAGMPGRLVKNAPYTADVVTESTQTLADGSHIRQSSTTHVARDSSGRTRRETSLAGLRALGNSANLPSVVFINDPVAGANYALNPANKTANKSTFAMGRGRGGNGPAPQQAMPRPAMGRPAGRAGRANAQNQNVKTESLGTQVIEGVTAQGTRTTLMIPAGQMGNENPVTIVNERWYSADLQTVVLSRHSDPRTGESVTRVTNLSRAEPPPTLFQVPSDFKVTEGRARPARGAAAQQ